jgi:hypothetical protein
MGWLKTIFILFCSILLYLHIFIHFKVNNFNEFTNIDDICKETITNTIHYKLPFVFDGSTIMKSYDLSQCTKSNMMTNNNNNNNTNNKNKFYLKTYEPVPMLEPIVKFFTNDTIYELSKPNKRIDIHKNLECRNFYMIHKGKVMVSCIHPKYKEHLQSDKTDEFVDDHSQILHIELFPNSVLFVPNYWYVSIKSLEKDTVVEKIQYTTILNKVNFWLDKYL